MPRFQVQVNKCKVCEKTVYPMEELIADSDHYHKPCFRCNKCNRTLSTGSYASLDGAIFCKPHFLQLFKQKGNYEEGFGKERYKNKWNDPAGKLEITSSGQTVTVKDRQAVVAAAETLTQSEEKKNISINGSKGNSHSYDLDHEVDEPLEDSTDGGVEEETTPISLEYKKTKLFQKPSPAPQVRQNTPGKLKSWQPVSTRRDDSAGDKPKSAPKKLNINWSARTQERATDRNEEPLKFTDMGGVKTKFETGDVGKKEYKSEARREISEVAQGQALSTKDQFENREEREYNSTKNKELEELKIARTLAANAKAEEEDEVELRDSRVEQENDRYRELEEFKKTAGTKQNLSKFESGAFSNVEQSEIETRKEVETIVGSGKAANTLRLYESGDYEKKEYCSPIRQELGTIKADTSSKKSLYEAGNVQREYESEAMKELESISVVAGETRSKFESGELINQASLNDERIDELEQIRMVSAAGDKKSKFESGELVRTEFNSDVRKEIETIKTDASDFKSKYESGGYIRTEFDSGVKKELETMSTGAMDTKNKYETGDMEQKEYDSVARQEAEEVKRLAASASIKSKYREAVEEGNKVITSKPVTIEKAPPGEDPFLSSSNDEDFKVTTEDANAECESQSDTNDDHVSDTNSDHLSETNYSDDDDDEYVAPVEPKRMTNIEERFKKPEVEKPAPSINKLKIPTYEKEVDSEEEVNGDVPDDEETRKLKEQMWPKNTANIKSKFETYEQADDDPKDTPKPIDLEAEISAYKEHMKKNRPRRHKPAKRKDSPVGENSDHLSTESPLFMI